MESSFDFKDSYFKFRNVTPSFYTDYRLPSYLLKVLPKDKDAKILDIGCGFGQLLCAIRDLGYQNVYGIDISEEAIIFCRQHSLNVIKVIDIIDFCNNANGLKYDFIIMSHVLEHISKNYIIPTLRCIKAKILNNDGQLLIMVPNAQSNTGCYWAYEDFTHETIFTAGSLYYVLKAAGFDSIVFLDPYCLDGLNIIKKYIKKLLLEIYIYNLKLWNKVTSSSYHKPSPQIFCYEIKALAK